MRSALPIVVLLVLADAPPLDDPQLALDALTLQSTYKRAHRVAQIVQGCAGRQAQDGDPIVDRRPENEWIGET